MSYNISITKLRKELRSIAKLLIEDGLHVTITTKEGNMVLLSEAEYRGILETLYLSSDSSLKQSIIEGIKTPLEVTIYEKNIKL